MHDLGIVVQAWMLFLCFLDALAIQVVEQKISFLINQQCVVIMLEIPTGKQSLKLFNNPLLLNHQLVCLIIFTTKPKLHHFCTFCLEAWITD